MAREIHDHFFREAKRHGYRSRAAYKLTELDDRWKLLKPGSRVLDCGAAPGSWCQIAAERIGPRGRVIGVDLKPIDPLPNLPTVTLLQGDLRETPAADLLERAGGPFDLILSDMAPFTTGDPRRDHHRSVRLVTFVLDQCPALLAPGGSVVIKVFEGETYPELLTRLRGMFESSKGFKPKASRQESVEMFLVGRGYRPAGANKADTEASHTTPAPPRPKTGW